MARAWQDTDDRAVQKLTDKLHVFISIYVGLSHFHGIVLIEIAIHGRQFL